jgi:hypothetical protein
MQDLVMQTKHFHFFKDAYEPNLLPPFRVIAETKGGTNPYFSTGAGGILQSVLMGFGGLDITPKGIVQVKSVLPKGWKSLTITGVGVERKTFTVAVRPKRSDSYRQTRRRPERAFAGRRDRQTSTVRPDGQHGGSIQASLSLSRIDQLFYGDALSTLLLHNFFTTI